MRIATRERALLLLLASLLVGPRCGEDVKRPPAVEITADVPMPDTADVEPPDMADLPDLPDMADAPEGMDAPDAPDVPDVPLPPDHVWMCKEYLALAEPFMALQEAELALAEDPDDPDALFCAALAGIVDRTEFALSLFTLMDMASTYVKQAQEPTWGDFVAGELHEMFAYLHEGYAVAYERLGQLDGVDLAFDVEAVWLYYAATPKLVYRGRFDRGDVQLMRVVSGYIMAVIDVIRGQDFRTDIATLVSFFVDNVLGSLNVTTIFQAIAYLLSVDERFLTLHPDEGVAAFEEVRGVLSTMGPDLRQALETIVEIPPPDGVEDVTTCEIRADGTYALMVHYRAEQDPESYVIEEKPIQIFVTPDVMVGLENVSEGVNTPGMLVPFDEGLQPVLAIMLSTLVETGILGDFELGGFSLAPDTFSAGQLNEILAMFVPSLSAFDFGTFFDNPVGLQAILPVYEVGDRIGEERFLMEWECPDDITEQGWPQGAQNFLCSAEAEIIDAPHFLGTPYEIPADGYLNTVPYMAWEDPTMNGVLYVDVSSVLPDQPEGYVPADRVTVNIFVAETLGPILDLLGK